MTVGTSAFVQAIKWALAGAAGATVVLGAAVALEPMRPAPAISATTPQPPPPHPSALAPEPPTRALVDPPAPSAASSARTFPVAPVVSPSSRGRSEPTEPLPEPAPAPSPSSAKSLLLEENRFLTAARRALQNGDATGALQTIDASRTRFPRAILAQERDALEALALAHGGRQAEARAKAATFLERYPTSPHAQQMIELGR